MFDNIRFEPEMRRSTEMPMQRSAGMSRFPEHTPLAMAYVPFQQWEEPYSDEKGFDRGTIFPELDMPFAPGEGCL
jgi:hypothetical protein